MLCILMCVLITGVCVFNVYYVCARARARVRVCEFVCVLCKYYCVLCVLYVSVCNNVYMIVCIIYMLGEWV